MVIQAARGDGRMSDYEEQLLTRVMLENSLDAVFVGPLENMTADGTDALCLSKIPANSIVLGWMPPSDAASFFSRLEMPWQIQQPVTSPGPSVRYRQIRAEQSIDELMNGLLQVLKNDNVKTLQISLPSATAQKSKPPSGARVPPASDNPTSERQPTLAQTSQPIRPFLQTSNRDESPRDQLDQLVDDLEALDL